MSVLILGSGVQGSVMATELVKDPDVSEVRIGDLSLDRAKQLAERLKSKKISVHRVNAGNIDDVVSAGKGTNLIVNASLPRFNLKVMEAALKCGAHYQDLTHCDNWEEQMDEKLDATWKKAGLTALFDTGQCPGITNVMAAHAADQLDRVDKIYVRFGSKTLKEPKEYISTWSPQVDWSEYSGQHQLYEGGKLTERKVMEVYDFPEPVGSVTLVNHLHNEIVDFPRYIGKGLNYAVFEFPVDPIRDFIDRIGMMSMNPIDVKGVKVAPRDVWLALIPPTPSMEEMERKYKAGVLGEHILILAVEVDGKKAGKKVKHDTYCYMPSIDVMQKKMPGSTTTSYVTGIPALIFTRMLCKGEIKTRGVFPPEILTPEVRKKFITELAKYDIFLTEKVERDIT